MPDDDNVVPINQQGGWQRDKQGAIKSVLHNSVFALNRLRHRFSFNVFKHRFLVTFADGDTREIDDYVISDLYHEIYHHFDFDPTEKHLCTAYKMLCRQHQFHPVIDYLDHLKWDGVERLSSWLETVFGVEPTPLSIAVARIQLIAAVRRARHPGCKHDAAVIFVSETQGRGMSEAIAILAVDPDWFSDSELLGERSKEQIEAMQGKWIVELCELSGAKRTEIEKLKAFISRQEDRARLAWHHTSMPYRRTCVFFGTTNDPKPLRDRTGNRRFWLFKVNGKVDKKWLLDNRDQLWAEAAEAEGKRESIILPEHLWDTAARMQAEHVPDDPWVDILAHGSRAKRVTYSPAPFWTRRLASAKAINHSSTAFT